MVYDPDDTIVAIGTASGGSVRGMVRLSGPQVIACLEECFQPSDAAVQLAEISEPSVSAGAIAVTPAISLPCDLFLWPTQRSYTRQPSAEVHTIGSPPLLQQLLSRLCECGARLAEPGEFTLRAFLAGRLDLTQAEAVLGVIDAQSTDDLEHSLSQLAGGLSQPLQQLREELLRLLAELEAGLDFVEEDIEFISNQQMRTQLASALALVEEASDQLSNRESATHLPRVVLSGAPNAGKSSLFNALVNRYGLSDGRQRALVSEQSGTTRDFVAAAVRIDELTFQLVDTAGLETASQRNSIVQIAQQMTESQRQQAALVVHCVDATDKPDASPSLTSDEVLVLTKSDLTDSVPQRFASALACSSVTGDGLADLASLIRAELASTAAESPTSLQLTANRCSESLTNARTSLARALELVESDGGEELIAAEVRDALHALGQVVGTVYTDDILDRIFSQFCIGK